MGDAVSAEGAHQRSSGLIGVLSTSWHPSAERPWRLNRSGCHEEAETLCRFEAEASAACGRAAELAPAGALSSAARTLMTSAASRTAATRSMLGPPTKPHDKARSVDRCFNNTSAALRQCTGRKNVRHVSSSTFCLTSIKKLTARRSNEN